MDVYAKMIRVIQPKREVLAVAEASLAEIEEQLAQKQAQLK